MPALHQADLSQRLAALPDWRLKGGRIEKSYQLSSFAAALEFVQQAAALAEAGRERPDIVIQGDGVTLSLGAGSQNDVSEHDLKLAAKLEKLPRR